MPTSSTSIIETDHPRLGEFLLKQLSNENTFDAAIESIIEIAKKLPYENQIRFIASLAEDLPNHDDFVKVGTYNANGFKTIEDVCKRFIKERNALYQNSINQDEKKREETQSQLKNLNVRFKNASKIKKTFRDEINRLLTVSYNAFTSLKNEENINWEKALHTLFTAPKGYSQDFFDAPLPTAENNKLALRDAFDKNPNMSHYLFTAPKTGGANLEGQDGGIFIAPYLDSDTRVVHTQTIFCKQATDNCTPNHRENIAEVVGGRIMNALIGDTAACTYFAVKPDGNKGNPDDIYVASLYHDNFEDVHTAAHKKADIKPIPQRAKGPLTAQEINVGNHDFQPGFIKLWSDKEIEKTSLSKALMASLLVGNYQIHAENVGIASYPDKNDPSKTEKQFAIIDFGAASRRPFGTGLKTLWRTRGKMTEENPDGRFERTVHPESPEGKKYGAAYLMAYPEAIRNSAEFIQGIDVIANTPRSILIKAVNDAVDYAEEYYGESAFIQFFANELDTGKPPQTLQQAKDFLIDTLLARQLSIAEYSLQKKIEIAQTATLLDTSALKKYADAAPTYWLCKKNNYQKNNLDDLDKALLSPIYKHSGDTAKPQFIQATAEHYLTLLRSIAPEDENDGNTSLIDYLDKALYGKNKYDFTQPDERDIIIQACDQAYQNIRQDYDNISDNTKKKEFLKKITMAQDETLQDITASLEKLKNKRYKETEDDKRILTDIKSYQDYAKRKDFAITSPLKERVSQIEREQNEVRKQSDILDESVESFPEVSKPFPAFTSASASATLQSSTAPNDPKEKEHRFTFTKTDNTTMAFTVKERVEVNRDKLTSELYIDPSMDTPSILANALPEKFHSLPLFLDKNQAYSIKKSTAFFKNIIQQLKKEGQIINRETFTACLIKNLKWPDKKDGETLTLALFKTYQNNTEQLDPYKEMGSNDESEESMSITHENGDPYENPHHFPSDAFIRTAVRQVDQYVESIGKKNPSIIISQSWDPHYTEAVLLYCQMKGYLCENRSGWKIEEKNLKEKKESFEEFFQTRYKTLQPGLTPSLSLCSN